MVVSMPLITTRSSTGTLVRWAHILSSPCCQTNSLDFLFEFHSGRFETLDLLILPDDRSQFDVHGALEDDEVK
jgi:hypothetical protein